MKKNASSVPFKGTPEQKAKLDAVIEAKKNIGGAGNIRIPAAGGTADDRRRYGCFG